MRTTELYAKGLEVRENGPTPQCRHLVCTVNDGPSMPERTAGEYARLFAAAPKMRAFLQKVVSECARGEEYGEEGSFDHTYFPRVHESELKAIERLLEGI